MRFLSPPTNKHTHTPRKARKSIKTSTLNSVDLHLNDPFLLVNLSTTAVQCSAAIFQGKNPVDLEINLSISGKVCLSACLSNTWSGKVGNLTLRLFPLGLLTERWGKRLVWACVERKIVFPREGGSLEEIFSTLSFWIFPRSSMLGTEEHYLMMGRILLLYFYALYTVKMWEQTSISEKTPIVFFYIFPSNFIP